MIHIRLLGSPSIERDGKPIPSFKSRKVLALLTYLALCPGAHSRSKLAGFFWSDVPEHKALDSLRFALWNLTETLKTNVFTADRLTVAWRANPEVWLDAHELMDPRLAGGQTTLTPEMLDARERVADLYRGDLLADSRGARCLTIGYTKDAHACAQRWWTHYSFWRMNTNGAANCPARSPRCKNCSHSTPGANKHIAA